MSEPTATILVVDDLPANRDLMTRRLERSGFSVVERRQRARGDRARPPREHRPRAARHHDAGHDRDRRAAHAARDALVGGAARGDGDREDRQRGHGRGVLARRQRLRHQARRLPGGARPHPDPPAHDEVDARRGRRRDRAAHARAGRARDRAGRALPARPADRRRQLRHRVPRAPPGPQARRGGEDPRDERRHRPRGARALQPRGPARPAACSIRTR